MTNKYLYGAVLAGMALSATATPPQFKLPVVGADPVKQSRTEVARKAPNKAHEAISRISSKKVAGPNKIVATFGDDNSQIDKYGRLELLLEEDFSLLTTGSEERPDFRTKLEYDWDDPEFTYPWWNFKPQYTHIEHWGVGGAYPAGGALYFHCENGEAHVNTTLVDCTKGEGNIAVLEFKARAFDPGTTYDYLVVEAADTRNMGPTWDIFEESVMFTKIPDEWTTYRVVYRNAGPTSLFNMVGVGPGYMLIDDIKVYQLHPNVDMPVILPHTEYKGTSFVANWKPVNGADKYVLNVWAIDGSNGEKDYLYENKELDADATSFEVKNAISGRTYYYNVVAYKGDQVSLPSFDQRVYDLEAPVLNPAEMLSDLKYKASWNDVPGADVYNYYAYNKREAKASGEYVVTNEDFTGVCDMDGYPTYLTKENPSDQTYSDYYSSEIRQQGWVGTNCCPYDDYIALDAYHYEMSGSLSAWMSPEMDFSKDGGKFTVDVDLAANTTTLYDENENPVLYTTQACAVIFNWDEEQQEYIQAEIFETWNTNPVEFDWKHYTFNFTKGSDRTKFAICAVTSLDNLYVDNLKITQNYQKGESLMDPFRYKRYHGFREGEVPAELIQEIPWWACTNDDIYHKVSAFSRQADQWGQSYDDRESAYSSLEYVTKTPAGVETVAQEQGNVTRMGNTLIISNPEGLAVNVYTMGGQNVFNTTDTQATVNLVTRGVYMVCVGNQTYKVIF